MFTQSRDRVDADRLDAVIKSPVFLVASERSGTTLLRLMLDGHPGIAWHFEFEWAVEQIRPDGSFPPVADYHRWLKTVRGFEDSQANVDTTLGYRDLVRSFLEQKRQRDDKPRVGAVVHRHFDRLHLIWPNARYIHLLRDGRDVARSCVALGWDGNAYCAAERWAKAENLWDRFRTQLEPSEYHEVRYEDLIAHPNETLTKICDFIGIEFDQELFSYVETSTYSYPNPKLVFQWRKKSSDKEIRLLEAKIGGLLEERGYKLSGLPRANVSVLKDRALHAQDRWRRRLHRIKFYGLPLLLAENVSRRLPGKPFHARILREMYKVVRHSLK